MNPLWRHKSVEQFLSRECFGRESVGTCHRQGRADTDLVPGEDQDKAAEADDENPIRFDYARRSVRWRGGEEVVFTEPVG
jgi:hypothetical protein